MIDVTSHTWNDIANRIAVRIEDLRTRLEANVPSETPAICGHIAAFREVLSWPGKEQSQQRMLNDEIGPFGE